MAGVDPLLVGLVAIVGFGTGFVKSGFGIGAGSLFVPLLATLFDPRVVLGVFAPINLLTDLTTIRAFWRRWDGATVRRLAPAALAGVLLGALFVSRASDAALRRAMGVIALLFVVVQARRLTSNGTPRRQPAVSGVEPAVASAVGLSGGVVSILAHQGGLVLSLYMLPRLSRAAFVASLAVLLLVLDTVKMPLLFAAGALTARDLALGLAVMPFMVIGSRLGERVNDRLSERAFLVGVTGLVFATGAWLLVR